MAVGLTRYFENLRYLFTLYKLLANNSDPTISLISEATDVEKYITIKGITQNENDVINIMNLKSATETEKTNKFYIKYGLY